MQTVHTFADLSNTIDETPPWLVRKAALDFLKLPIENVASEYDYHAICFKVVTHGGAYDFATRGCRVDCFSVEANGATSKDFCKLVQLPVCSRFTINSYGETGAF